MKLKVQAGRIFGELWIPVVALVAIGTVGIDVNRIREEWHAISTTLKWSFYEPCN